MIRTPREVMKTDTKEKIPVGYNIRIKICYSVLFLACSILIKTRTHRDKLVLI